MATAGQPAISTRGHWQPTPILYGFATFPFQPASYGPQSEGSDKVEGESINPHQIPLEVGDEVYIFEQYVSAVRPAGDASEIWFRCYSVSTVREVSSIATTSLTEAANSLAEEPQVFVGIVPASHIQIREQLEDSDKRITDLLASQATNGGLRMDKTKSGHMAALPEEDESEASSPALKLSPTLDRFPTAAIALAAPDGRRVSTLPQSSSSPKIVQKGSARPPPPLPSLKCGDETAAGIAEPLIDEIACALREWASLLHVYLLRRQYSLFHAVRAHIDALHAGRRKLLSRNLAADEVVKLRKELIERLVEGNTVQGLDIIVRHPEQGGLVDVEIAEADEAAPTAMSAARMFSTQVALAYKNATTTSGQPDNAASALEASPDFAAPPERAKMHHVYVELRAFVGSLCQPGETAELAFSLFNKSDTRFVTEECCIIVDHHGNANNSTTRTLFVDLSAHDMQDSMFLVCRIVKNGALRSGSNATGTGPSTSGMGGFDETMSIASSDALGTAASATSMLHTLKNGRQSVRRPFGCAVLDLGQLAKETGPNEVDRAMSIFVPFSENAFSTLHEDIIASRTRDFEKNARADVVVVRVSAFHGASEAIVRDHPSLLEAVPTTQRLGFPDVVEPGLVRNDVYLKLWSGDFGSGAVGRASPSRNIEVDIEVRHADGAVMRNVISRGSGEQGITHYSSIVFKGNNAPTFGELFKLEVPTADIETSHVFFTFRHRTGKGTSTASETPFAFAYLPLFVESTFIPDGSHGLVLYRYDTAAASPSCYLECPPVTSPSTSPVVPTSLSKLIVVSKDSMIIRTFLCSTKYTQNEVLLRLFRWEKVLLPDVDLLRTTLSQLRYCGETEIAKHLRPVLDALFGILASSRNQQHELSDLIFADLVTILAIVADRRFNNFRPVLETYITRHFVGSTVHTHLLRSLQMLLAKRDDTESAQMLRSSIKVWEPLFRFVLRSREVQRTRTAGMDVTSDHVESVFRKDVSAVLQSINNLMRATAPASIIGTQTLAIQHFSGLLPSLSKIFPEDELVDAVVSFCESLPAAASKGKPAVWKLLLLVNIVKSVLLAEAASRATLVPYLVRWCKPHLGRFDERALIGGKDTQATKDNTRISWLEGCRLAISVLAALSDRLQTALADPSIRMSRPLLAQEQDNAEYVLTLLPRIIETFRECEAAANVEALERARSVAASRPATFPASYPFTLLTFPVPSPPDHDPSTVRVVPPARPGLSNLASEAALVALALLHTAPSKILGNFLQSAFEVEGKDNFARFLSNLFRFLLSTLEGAAWPATWLNVHILAHRVILKISEPAAALLEREYIPPQSLSYTFNFALWRDYFAMLLRLLVSEQLVIEEFSPQKRRAIWRLAGDLRGTGAKILLRLWKALGWPEGGAAQATGVTRLGGYQIQLGPGLVELDLELCLSHHDELRSNAVLILYSLIINEWNLNEDFSGIQTDIIDRLDKLFSSKKRDDVSVSQALFVTQLRGLFEASVLSPSLREQVTNFLNSVAEFLDLLLGIRNLPEGEEWTDDRVVGTLRLMSFVRGVNASPIFVRYIGRLCEYHVASGHYAEAGLTLKLHADLYTWNASSYLDPIPEFGLARETELARKESLYHSIIELLTQGRAWETALSLCKELQDQFETKLYAYQRLSESLARQALLYAKIVAETRVYPMYFRVGYYGRGFPVSVQNKQFVYRGNDMERLAAFCERMHNKHPKATLLKTNTFPDETIQFSDGQYLQITAVTPEPDKSAPIFTNPDVPTAVKAYYEANETNLFSFSRTVEKDVDHSIASLHNALLSRWVEKTILVCEHSFPTVLRRTEVNEIRVIEQSPLETALLEVNAKKVELEILERRYLAASQVEGAKVNTNVLSMTLNSVVDTGDAGIPLYRKIFFGPQFTSSNPSAETTALVTSLRKAIDQQVRSIDRCMKLHAALCPVEMQPFHDTLESFFDKNFLDERRRLPAETFPPIGITLPSPSRPALPLSPTLPNGSTHDTRSRAGSTGGRSGAISPPPSSILHTLAETNYEHTLMNGGHISRFSESLVGQAPLSPVRPLAANPPSVSNGRPISPPSLGRTSREKAADRLSILGSRLGSLRRKKASS